MPLVEARGLTRTYRKGEQEIRPLDGLDLDIDAGRFVALMGPSGSGKSTLLNLLAGIDRPTAGSLVVDGVDLAALSRRELAEWRSRKVSIVFQLYNLVPVLTAYENVELPLLLHDLPRRERHARVVRALERAHIAHRHDHMPRQLSGGEEQRVAIARAIVTEPALLLADEPTGDLDRSSAESILDLLSSLHRDEGRTIVMVTHDPRAAERAQATLHLEKGRVAETIARTGAKESSRAPANTEAHA
ncbi:MAG: ABC transporter ATP-binding protein [Phycisphaerae bacterium]|nr:ABC transporter ATP-binding protein [Phycisphaerae bacterium]